jgi:hypothetical protein
MPIRDTRMMAKALEQRWPISDNARRAIIGRLLKIIADPQSSAREVTAASKAILSAEAQNQADEHKIVDVSIARRHAELDAIAADLGVEIGVIEDASRKAADNAIGTQRTGEPGVVDGA